ncbi:hypothetical protein DSO57_1008056 [Entomophthora muscae]|uniref:Uncharacterized protein n=1 Tax=Entomophthora muscae TaxID=34485 RepID=A0ACC2RLX8_9FUNG|nr:hypothetical protein DSO57_1008056 [Entomophthora muscae]
MLLKQIVLTCGPGLAAAFQSGRLTRRYIGPGFTSGGFSQDGCCNNDYYIRNTQAQAYCDNADFNQVDFLGRSIYGQTTVGF